MFFHVKRRLTIPLLETDSLHREPFTVLLHALDLTSAAFCTRHLPQRPRVRPLVQRATVRLSTARPRQAMLRPHFCDSCDEGQNTRPARAEADPACPGGAPGPALPAEGVPAGCRSPSPPPRTPLSPVFLEPVAPGAPPQPEPDPEAASPGPRSPAGARPPRPHPPVQSFKANLADCGGVTVRGGRGPSRPSSPLGWEPV